MTSSNPTIIIGVDESDFYGGKELTVRQEYVGPYIDETIEHVGVSRLRTLNATNLRNIEKTFVIQDNDRPLAVLLSYDHFLAMQRQLLSVINTLEFVSGEDERTRFTKGIQDLKAGREKTLHEVQQELIEETR